MSTNIVCKIAVGELEMNQLFALRKEVFVLEQHVPEELEYDEYDAVATHVIALDNEKVVGCGRIIFKGRTAKIGRMAVKKNCRKMGIGKMLMQQLIHLAKDRSVITIELGAQLHAVRFYEALGFQKKGDIFLDAGIEHVSMVLTMAQ